MHYHTEALIKDLSAKAQSYRIQVLKMVNKAQSGHIGGAFSAAEILTALYFHHLRVDPTAAGLGGSRSADLLQGPCLRHAVHLPGPSRLLSGRGTDDLSRARQPACRGTRTSRNARASRCAPGRWVTALPIGVGMALAQKSRMAGSKPSACSAPRAGPRSAGPMSSWATVRSTPAWCGKALWRPPSSSSAT